MLNIIKTVSVAAVLAGMAMSTAVANNSGHINLAGCYAAIQVECYGNGENNCSNSEYNQGLDWCDQSYPTQSASRPPANKKTKVRGGNIMLSR